MIKLGGPAPAVTRYDYGIDGKLAAVTAPDPSVSGVAFVTFTYTFDAIGRPTGMRRPDATGVDLFYDGLSQRTEEEAGTLGGPEAITELVHDEFGRLVAVNERLDSGADATTTYAYDPRDTIELVVDPEGVTTEMEHDFAGRRTKIHRVDRTWELGYDRNGNVIFEISPVPYGRLASDYTTSFAYDDLDRLTSEAVAGRDLSGHDRTLFGIGVTEYGYDGLTPGENGIGRLDGVSDGATLKTTLRYDAEGNVIEEKRDFTFADLTGARRIRTTYGPSGRVREVDYGDGLTTDAPSTRARYRYDDRAQPILVELQRAGAALPETAASFTRNVAGLVTTRVRTGSPTQTAKWRYDQLGRVVRTEVRAPNVVVDQQLSYFGSDDPKTLRHSGFGLEPRVFQFGYDKRHQLVSAATTSPRFAGSYQLSEGGRLHQVTVDAQASPGSDVRNRDVEYLYGTVDPEMLVALRRPDGTNFASYVYDESGNVSSQIQEGASTTFTWDGEDQLRRATAAGGTEEYFYDHAGTRVAVVQRNPAGVITQWKYFQGPLEVWFGPDGAATRRLAHCGMGTPVARVETTTGAPTVELQYHSTLQNLMASISTSGEVTSAFVYGPYGEVLQAGGSQQTSHRRRYNDKQKDDLTGLYYYGARFFDSTALVWKSADPSYRFSPETAWKQPRRAALYVFDTSNPLSYVDPDGRDGNPLGWITCMFGGCNEGTPTFGGYVAEKAQAVTIPPVVDAAASVLVPGWAEGRLLVDILNDDFEPLSRPGFRSTKVPGEKRIGTSTTDAKIAQKVSTKLSSANCKFECGSHASQLQSALEAKGVSGNRITLTPSSNTFIFSDANGVIADKGMPHIAIEVGGKVFDNMNPKGVPYNEWIKDLGGEDLLKAAGVSITKAGFGPQ